MVWLMISYMTQPLRDTPTLGPNDALVQMGDMFRGACPPSPLVVGIVVVHFLSSSSTLHNAIGSHDLLFLTEIHGYHWVWSCRQEARSDNVKGSGVLLVSYGTPSRAGLLW